MNWTEIKKATTGMEQKELIKLIGDLYKLSPENKRFLATRFASPTAKVGEYKKLISKAVNPPSLLGRVRFTEGKKVISEFKKASGDLEVLADLMLYFVEEANQQTLKYGGMNREEYYITIENMFKKTLELILELRQQRKDYKHLLDRAYAVVESTVDIGWGYHDQLKHDYTLLFPDK